MIAQARTHIYRFLQRRNLIMFKLRVHVDKIFLLKSHYKGFQALIRLDIPWFLENISPRDVLRYRRVEFAIKPLIHVSSSALIATYYLMIQTKLSIMESNHNFDEWQLQFHHQAVSSNASMIARYYSMISKKAVTNGFLPRYRRMVSVISPANHVISSALVVTHYKIKEPCLL